MNIESNLQLVTNLLTSIITLITIVITGRQGKEKAKDTAERLVSNFLKAIIEALLLSFLTLLLCYSFVSENFNINSIYEFAIKQSIFSFLFPVMTVFTSVFNFIYSLEERNSDSQTNITNVVEKLLVGESEREINKLFWSNVSKALIKAIMIIFSFFYLALFVSNSILGRESQKVNEYPNSASETILVSSPDKNDKRIMSIEKGTVFKVINHEGRKLKNSNHLKRVSDVVYLIKSGTEIVLPRGTVLTAENSYKTEIYENNRFVYEAESVPGTTKETLSSPQNFKIYFSKNRSRNMKVGTEGYKITVFRSVKSERLMQSVAMILVPLSLLLFINLMVYGLSLDVMPGEFIFLFIITIGLGLLSLFGAKFLALLFLLDFIALLCYFIRINNDSGNYYAFDKRNMVRLIRIKYSCSYKKTIILYHNGFCNFGKIDVLNKTILFEKDDEKYLINYTMPKKGNILFEFDNKRYELYRKSSKSYLEYRNFIDLKGAFYSLNGTKEKLILKNGVFRKFILNGKKSSFEYDCIRKVLTTKYPAEEYYKVMYQRSGKLILSSYRHKLILYRKGSFAFKEKLGLLKLKGKFCAVDKPQISDSFILKINKKGNGKILLNNRLIDVSVDYEKNLIISKDKSVKLFFRVHPQNKLVVSNSDFTLVLYKGIKTACKVVTLKRGRR